MKMQRQLRMLRWRSIRWAVALMYTLCVLDTADTEPEPAALARCVLSTMNGNFTRTEVDSASRFACADTSGLEEYFSNVANYAHMLLAHIYPTALALDQFADPSCIGDSTPRLAFTEGSMVSSQLLQMYSALFSGADVRTIVECDSDLSDTLLAERAICAQAIDCAFTVSVSNAYWDFTTPKYWERVPQFQAMLRRQLGLAAASRTSRDIKVLFIARMPPRHVLNQVAINNVNVAPAALCRVCRERRMRHGFACAGAALPRFGKPTCSRSRLCVPCEYAPVYVIRHAAELAPLSHYAAVRVSPRVRAAADAPRPSARGP
jgi:hypothetical protein